MKLAEAIATKGSLRKRIDKIYDRLTTNYIVREGDAPIELPKDILAELKSHLFQVEVLTVKISTTNRNTILPDGTRLSDKLTHRDMLKKQIKIIHDLLEYLTDERDLATFSECKYNYTFDVPALLKKRDQLSKELRKTDMTIHATNWTIDLIE